MLTRIVCWCWITRRLLLSALFAFNIAPSAFGQTLTRIMRTDDPIPGSPGVHCEGSNQFISAVIDHGDVALVLRCTNAFSAHLLFWDGEELKKIADHDTPIPGQTVRKMLFQYTNDAGYYHLAEISLAGGAQPRVLFESFHEHPERSVLYEWRPDTGIGAFPSESSQFKWPVSGTLASNGDALIWMKRSLELQPELHLLDSEAILHRLLSEGNSLSGAGTKVDFIQSHPFFFNGIRVLVNIDTTPYSDRGWWSLNSRGTTPTSMWKVESSRIQSPSDASISYETIQMMDISPPHSDLQSTVAIGEGPIRKDWPAKALLYSPDPNKPFQVILETTLPVPDRPEFSFIDFNAAQVIGGSVVFSGVSVDRDFNFLNGIYEWQETGLRTLMDSSEPIDGVFPGHIRVLGRDNNGEDILVAANFSSTTAPFEFDALYIMSMTSTPTFAEWLTEELGEFGEGELITGIEADPDGDGVANLLEYALGGDPGEKDTASTLPEILIGNDGIAIEYSRRATLPDEVSVVNEVFDPATRLWMPASDKTEESIVPSERAGFDRVTIRPHSSNKDGLYRVRVNHTPE